MSEQESCIFCRIVRGEIPATKVYEDDLMVAFKDLYPKAPVHLLLIPKKHIKSLADSVPEDDVLLGKMLGKTREIAAANGATNGYRVVINSGRDGCQEVPHLHIHIKGGAHPWPKE